jgi:galactose mutarotase-like enzyme
MFCLENEFIKIQVDPKGAELKSVYNKSLEKEILYDGKSPFWNRSAPILFPIVGRLKENSYHHGGANFELSQHGFARNEQFALSEQNENQVVFSLKSSEKSLEIFPFEFELKISYVLENEKVITKYQLINSGKKELLFSIGAHPGFVCPIHENENFEDYFLEFEEKENLERHLLNCETGLFTGETEILAQDSSHLDLSYSYFLKDAIVFKDLKSTWIKLKSKKSTYCLTFSFENFPYFGIWTKENAQFICLEPWCGLADSENSSQKFEQKEGINYLLAGEKFERKYSFWVNFYEKVKQ